VLLARLEQAWDAAVAANDGRGSPCHMLQVIRLQAEISGIIAKGAANRADLWDLPDDAVREVRSQLLLTGEIETRRRLDRVAREHQAHGAGLAARGVSLTKPDMSGAGVEGSFRTRLEPTVTAAEDAEIDAAEAGHGMHRKSVARECAAEQQPFDLLRQNI